VRALDGESPEVPLRRLAVFFRNPVRGRVKTRLARELGEGQALAAYRAMAQDLLANLESIREMVVAFFDDLPAAGPRAFAAPGEQDGAQDGAASGRRGDGAGVRLQRGRDLGARMAAAFSDLFAEGVQEVLLIGSDIPQIDSFLIAGYFQALAAHDLVLGPAADGGYYLVGFRRDSFAPELFEGIDWSTDRVYRQTLARARELGLSVHSGKTLRDIDTYEDLQSLLQDRSAELYLYDLVRLFLQRKGA